MHCTSLQQAKKTRIDYVLVTTEVQTLAQVFYFFLNKYLPFQRPIL